MNEKSIWSDALTLIKETTGDSVGFKLYIEPALPVKYSDDTFLIRVSMPLIKNMIERRYKDFIESALEKITGNTVSLKIEVEDSSKTNISDTEDTPTGNDDNPSKHIEDNDNVHLINPYYTFENFVIGSSNQITTAYAIRVAEKPGYVYNPLFLYGNSGLGKTHLMYAIGNRIKQNFPDYRIMYTTTEMFTSEFVDSLENNSTMDFKHKYRNIDVLLIDDIQFIETKKTTQEEFFHTFNTLYAQNKQIVITSDRKPRDLIQIEERLINRFSQGLTADLSVPDLETRIAILQSKAQMQHKTLPKDVLQYIAERINSNVRELEGALTKIISVSQISKKDITIEFAEGVIKSILPEDGIVKITSDKIIEKVALFYNISVENLTGTVRTQEYAFPRQVAMYLCYKLTDMRYSMIGKAFSNKDRTTVMHNVKKIEDKLKTNADLKSNINYIIQDLESV